tara:strand:+ start:3247 stop:5139 length:1893 start_codon:yes stop_codon:yes gene_type:complete
MGTALEAGKIIAALWLHKNWKIAPMAIKIYLSIAIFILMGITSMGIFGFLSKSHIEHEQTSIESQALALQVDNKISRQRDFIERQKTLIDQNKKSDQNLGEKSQENIRLEQDKITQISTQLDKDLEIDNKTIDKLKERLSFLDQELRKIKDKSGGLFSSKKKDIELKVLEQKEERESLFEKIKGAEARITKQRDRSAELISEIRGTIKEYQSISFSAPEGTENKIETFNLNISEALDKIDELEQEKFKHNDGTRQLEAEVGPIKYVAELISDFSGIEFDINQAVRIVIIILILVFDPLAILLVLAAHISLLKKFPDLSQSETSVLVKSAELQIKVKDLEKKETNIRERAKDVQQEEEILELKETHLEKYRHEISKLKEESRQIKIQAEKNKLSLEDTSPIKEEIENLLKEKHDQLKALNGIKEEKKGIICKLKKFDQDCEEIKSVFTNHKQNKDRISDLKKGLVKSEGSLIELKLLTESLEKENETLKSSNGNRDILSKENLKLKTQLEKAVLESRELEGLKAENLKLKKRKSEQIEKNIIFKSKIGQNLYQLQIPSEIGGTHQFVKDGDFSKPEILNCQAIASEIDEICPERKGPLLLKVFNTNIKKYLDDRLDNREYKKNRPEYTFIS